VVKEEYKKKLVDLISKYFPEARIYLYGSRARGEHGETSDIDVAVDVGERAEKHKMAMIRLSIDDLNIPLEVDVVDFYSVSKEMQSNIKKEGVVWKK